MSLDSGELASADDAGRYRLDSRIATGGMGEVWRGTDTVLDRPVAIKMLKHEYADNPLFRTRFEGEARHAAGLRHPGVAQVFDFGIQGERPYLVMELVEGKPLNALLKRGQPMPAEAARDLVAQAASALGAAHAVGIVHRDVKPANLIVTPDQRVKVTDFGIARAADSVALTETGQVLGTPQYFSPEQAEGRATSPASDVYALGVIGYECLAGRRPFEADSAIATALAHLREPVPELPGNVPAGLAAVVRRAMAKNPAERYADGATLAEALRSTDTPPAIFPESVPATQVLTDVVPATAPAGAPSLGAHTGGLADAVRRVPVPLLAAGAVFVLVVAVALAANLTSGGASSGPSPGGGSSRLTHPTAPTTPPTTGPATHSTATVPSTTPTISTPSTPTISAPTTKTKGPKPPKGHGHKGKGHQK